ncbi:MAG: undecaprenyl-diphosphate phosphatase [Eubacteriales bacterium]|nr:undecaprenyl-diphosphate phosphatase [Eubacteriales bacterium]
MTIWYAMLLGLIQGVAEFLPISSSGHLSVFQNIFSMQTAEDGHMFFDVLLHLGTLAAVIAAYWSDIKSMVFEVLAIFRSIRHPSQEPECRRPAGRLALMLVLGTLPLFLILPVMDQIEKLYYSTFFIGLVFLLTGCMLYISDRMAQGNKREGSMRVRDALLIGLCQCVGTIPGLSRSGVTITAGLAAGLDRKFAVKFSLLLSIPAVLGANLLGLLDAIGEPFDWSCVPAYLVGMLTAAVSGYFAIRLLRYIADRRRFGAFAYYCWGIGVVTIILSMIF